MNNMTEISLKLLPVFAGFVLDLMFGDPRWMYHPVRAIGKLIEITEKMIRKLPMKTKAAERAGGAFLVLIVMIVGSGIPFLILHVLYKYSMILGILMESFMCYQILATKALKDESRKVYDALTAECSAEEQVKRGRKAVSMIVGRDTQALDAEGVTKAAVETVAENTSDGIIAPLFYMMIGGAVFGFAYKSVNTMDSMIGYKNETYRYFGTVAAKLDDIVNYLPARISAIFMMLASKICGLDWKNAWAMWKRDRHNHKSPNAAQTEAVMAGALDVQLAGNAWYFGELYEKPTIGDPIREIEKADIIRSHYLLYGTAILALLIMGLVKFAVLLVM